MGEDHVQTEAATAKPDSNDIFTSQRLPGATRAWER